IWFFWPAPGLVELEPAASVRPRSAAIQAYEAAWWTDTRERLTAYCATLDRRASAAVAFIVYVHFTGRIIRIDVGGDVLSSHAYDVRETLGAAKLAPFSREQRAERLTLGMRGSLYHPQRR